MLQVTHYRAIHKAGKGHPVDGTYFGLVSDSRLIGIVSVLLKAAGEWELTVRRNGKRSVWKLDVEQIGDAPACTRMG